MKIAVIFNNRLPTERAHGLQIIKTCEAFAKNGIETELIIPDISGEEKNIFEYYQVQKFFSVKQKKCRSKNYRVRYLIFIIKLLFSGIDKKKIIFTRHPEIAFLFSRLGYKVIFELHNWRAEKKIRNIFLLRKVFLIIATTEIIKKKLVESRFGKKNILVAPNGVELKDFDLKLNKNEIRKKLNLPLDKKIILYAGHLYPQKGIYTIINAAKMLPEKHFVFIGGLKNEVENLKEFAIGLKNVEIRGSKKYFEVPEYLKAADFLIIANSGKNETERMYTSPLKLFEYLAAGNLIIASRVPAIEEFLDEKTAVFFEPDNSQDLVKVIMQVSENLELEKKLASNAFEKSKNYTWQERTKKIIEFIKKHG